MMRFLLAIARNRKATSVVEFALLAPALFTIIIGIAQLGILFLANAGLKSAVGEGARYATIFPRPTTDQIVERITDRRYGLEAANIAGPTVTSGVANKRDYLDIQMRYEVPLDFIFFSTPPVTLVENRRVFVHPL